MKIWNGTQTNDCVSSGMQWCEIHLSQIYNSFFLVVVIALIKGTTKRKIIPSFEQTYQTRSEKKKPRKSVIEEKYGHSTNNIGNDWRLLTFHYQKFSERCSDLISFRTICGFFECDLATRSLSQNSSFVNYKICNLW